MIPKIISNVISDEMSEVDTVIRGQLHSRIPLISEIGDHLIGSGGKRLRPALVVLSALASNYQSGMDHFRLAAVVEFIHTATLLHDDVVDESGLRRGRTTANVVFGNAATVLVGDFLYSRAFQLVAQIRNPEVTKELANATNTIAEGEIKQLINLQDPEISEDTYYNIVRSKTAQLFETSGKLGGILGGLEADAIDALGSYGMHMGTAFQLVDDALDYSGDEHEIGKNLGDDFFEGKVTLPLIHVIKNGSMEEAEFVKNAIKNNSMEDLKRVKEILKLNKVIEYVHHKADHEVNQAIAALDIISPSKYKTCLIELAQFATNRTS